MAFEDEPLIMAFVSDLYFSSRIESVTQRMGFTVLFIERDEEDEPNNLGDVDIQYAEHLDGQGGALLDKLTQQLPALIIFDLGNADIAWRKWILLIKSSPATRRTPVLCFGSHMDTESMKAAKAAGADAVLARSKFVQSLSELIQKYTRRIDYDALKDACQHSLSEIAVRGLEEFNRGEYFEAHESLEDAWNQDQTAGRELYRAILQVAVAYLQIERRNFRGAMKMFLRLRQWIDPLPDMCRGVNVAQLRSDALQVHEALKALGPEHINEFDHSLFAPVLYFR